MDLVSRSLNATVYCHSGGDPSSNTPHDISYETIFFWIWKYSYHIFWPHPIVVFCVSRNTLNRHILGIYSGTTNKCTHHTGTFVLNRSLSREKEDFNIVCEVVPFDNVWMLQYSERKTAINACDGAYSRPQTSLFFSWSQWNFNSNIMMPILISYSRINMNISGTPYYSIWTYHHDTLLIRYSRSLSPHLLSVAMAQCTRLWGKLFAKGNPWPSATS